MTEKTTIGGIPVECLTGEPAAIWSGWRTLGDRELVREASAKGTHINLAYKCLAYRRNWSLEDAHHYFNKEVEVWITELLKKHQVFRASHILKNVGKNPQDYIFEVCTKCKDSTLRNYLSEYLINVARFENEHIGSWNIIKSINQFEQKFMIQDGLSSYICIEDIMKLPENVKQALCTELYFSIAEEHISKNITNTVLWDYLLSNNKIDLIEFWIDTCYNDNSTRKSYDFYENYRSLLSTLEIKPSMLESIDTSNASDLVKTLTKTHLCRYGIFTKNELDLRSMLARVFGSAITLKKLETILSNKSCNVDRTEFLQNIDEQLCVAHCLRDSDTEEDKLKVSKMFKVLTETCEANEHYEDTLERGIFETIRYISDDTNKFLQQNYLIVLALIFLHLSKTKDETRNDNLIDVFSNRTDLQIGAYSIPIEILRNTLKQIPILENVIERKSKPEEITMYDLLDGYNNLNVKQLFKWRFRNEPMPSFSNEILVKKFGYVETLTYMYYLKEARPNMAIHVLKHARGKMLGTMSSRRKSKAALYAHILALRHLDEPEIICSCISFIEMLGIDSENLRLHVTTANYVQKELNVSIGNLLESIIYKNESDLKSVISYLETSFQKNFKNDNLIVDSQRFVEALKVWDVIIRFARAHNSTLPDSLLVFLAKGNHWFEFVLVCHIFTYPINQVLENAKEFEDSTIREHLLTCLNNMQLSKSYSVIYNEQKLKSRDARQSLYYKIGVKQSSSPTSASPISSIDTSSTDSYVSTFEHMPMNNSICSPDDGLWLTILKCHQSPDPPGALIKASRSTLRPFLTILATCYEPSSTAAYCYSWMVISTADEDILSSYKECLEQQIWPANKVFDLLDGMILRGYFGTLSRAYKIFMPESAFNPLFEFLMQCANNGDFRGCQQNLLDFKSRCLTLKCNKIMDWDNFDTTYLKNMYWVAAVAVRCVVTTLAHGLRSSHLQIKFLEVLTKYNFEIDLPVQVPDFRVFLQLTKILQKTNVTLNYAAYTFFDHIYNFDDEIKRCINDLLTSENYNSALEVSNVAGLDSSEIILAQCRNEFKRSMEKNGTVEAEFWKDCARRFKDNVSGEKAAEFFVEHAEKVVSHKERYEILKLAFETLKNVEAEQQIIDTLEMAMWKSCILAGPENIQLDNGNYVFNKLRTNLLSGLSNLQVTCTLTDAAEQSATEILINKLIDAGQLDVALRISTIFNYKHKDLQVLMLCLSLAEGEMLPSQLSTEQESLLTETTRNKQQKYGILKNRAPRRFSSSSSLNASSLSPSSPGEASKVRDESIYKIQKECLTILENLLEVLNHGSDICLRIVLCYKLALQLGKSYHFLVLQTDPLQFLQEVADSNVDNKFEIVNDIITAYKINSESTATFLANNITTTISHAIEDGFENYIYMWGRHLNTSFHVIMELCSDVSQLGWKLLVTATKLLGHSHGEKRNVTTLKTIVELLIRSHDCFTASCNMEGIASVLRKCQNLANTLQNFKYWTLLVRLVTGVGRFTEMNYVFQILKENDQFEFLLGKGLDKVVGLKTALLEFLKRHCPENKELFTLVSHHFCLYQEIALMWENEAKNKIKELISEATKDCGKLQNTSQVEIKLTKTDNVEKLLYGILTSYMYATEHYSRDSKLNLASRCSDQAHLVSLQLSLLSTVPYNQQVVCILNLKSEDVDKILCNVLNFSQALVVMHAYGHHVDWANLIYNHCILNGETKYLKDFVSANKLTPTLVQDCVRRYRLEKSITHKMTDNMRILISELSDIECKYMLASQLGFKNIVEAMLNNPLIGAYLKDTVWKKGYNAL